MMLEKGICLVQARDVALLCAPQPGGTYNLQASQCCDMFPQTTHIENLICLQWVSEPV